jgi:hypothetical protein
MAAVGVVVLLPLAQMEVDQPVETVVLVQPHLSQDRL